MTEIKSRLHGGVQEKKKISAEKVNVVLEAIKRHGVVFHSELSKETEIDKLTLLKYIDYLKTNGLVDVKSKMFGDAEISLAAGSTVKVRPKPGDESLLPPEAQKVEAQEPTAPPPQEAQQPPQPPAYAPPPSPAEIEARKLLLELINASGRISLAVAAKSIGFDVLVTKKVADELAAQGSIRIKPNYLRTPDLESIVPGQPQQTAIPAAPAPMHIPPQAAQQPPPPADD
jgi:hypothetical protein